MGNTAGKHPVERAQNKGGALAPRLRNELAKSRITHTRGNLRIYPTDSVEKGGNDPPPRDDVFAPHHAEPLRLDPHLPRRLRVHPATNIKERHGTCCCIGGRSGRGRASSVPIPATLRARLPVPVQGRTGIHPRSDSREQPERYRSKRCQVHPVVGRGANLRPYQVSSGSFHQRDASAGRIA